jgi:hypothetical protein
MTAGKRILLMHLVSLGDCLYVTAIARQIKQDYPGCHLTWAISNRCSQVIQNNPYVDEIWEIVSDTMSGIGEVWEKTKKEALEKKEKGEYDYIFFTQINPDNFFNYDGTIRSSTFRGYPHPITVPVTPIINLTENEIENVNIFVKLHKINDFKHVIMFENSPGSNQSPVNDNFTMNLSKKIVENFKDSLIIISSHKKIPSAHERIIDASSLTFRENAELSKHCSLLIGCSSGITWLLTSSWAKKIPTIQILKKRALLYEFASVNYDLKYWGQPTDHIVEITKFSEDHIFNCVNITLKFGIGKAREKYNEILKPSFKSIFYMIAILIYRRKFGKISEVWRNFYERNRELFLL